MSISSKAIIDTDALVANYKLLSQMTNKSCNVAAVVKADGYGAGMIAMAEILMKAGCRHFYTAQLSEAVMLRQAQPNAHIIVFDGPQRDADFLVYRAHNLVMVLNSVEQLRAYIKDASQNTPLPCWLHFDTGMARLGLGSSALGALDIDNLPIQGYMSHLASADTAESEQNELQLAAFHHHISTLPKRAMSFANSGGIFLGADYHFDQVRPGLSLHGYASDSKRQSSSGLKPILRWDAPILQIRTLKKGDTIGYGASFIADGPMRVATIGAGYADGYRRSLQSKGQIDIAGHIVKPVGRISMDLLVVDVTHVPETILETVSEACLLGPHYTAQNMADDLDTIAYEVLTSLGDRVHRAYDASEISA